LFDIKPRCCINCNYAYYIINKKRIIMNKIYSLLLLVSIFCNTIISVESTFTPGNTELIFDIDEVLVARMGYGIYEIKLAIGGIMQNPLHIIQYIIAVFNLVKAFIKNSNGNYALY